MKEDESYIVRYWIQGLDGYWHQEEETITSSGKSDHDKVEKKWQLNHKKDKVKLVSIIYQ